MQSKDRPYVLFVAEKIYFEVSKLKKSKMFLDPNLILAISSMKKNKI